MNKDIKICFMGSPLFGRIVLEKLNKEYTVVLVVTQPDSFSNGGRKVNVPEVKKYALENGLEVFQSENIKENHKRMEEVEFDFLVTAAYGQFIPKSVLELPKKTVLNVHGSALPKYRGGAPIERAIEAGDEYLGVSIMKTVLKMDAGEVYKTSLIKNEKYDTYGSLLVKLADQGKDDLCEIIDKMWNSEVIGEKQNVEEVTFAPNISKEECILDFNEDAKKLVDKIKAFNPNPLTYFNHDCKYKVYMAEVVENDSNKAPGTIIESDKELIIKCGKNAIRILEIQREGKQKMDVKSFLNGYKTKFIVNELIYKI